MAPPTTAVSLRSLELRLLRCSIPSENPSPPPPQSTPSELDRIIALIESGNYPQAIYSSHFVFSDLKFDSSDSAQRFYTETLPQCITGFLNGDELETGYRALLLMAVGVSALLAFAQCNVTGPTEKLPCMPLAEMCITKDEKGGGDWMEWDTWARAEVMSVGSELLGKFSNLQYLIFAKTLLQETKDFLFQRSSLPIDGVKSITWWLGRVLFLQQRLLNERSSHLFDMLQVFKQESLLHLGTLKKIEDYWGMDEDCSAILPMLHIELGLLELFYGRVDASRVHFESAADISDYNFFVSGDLGYRTVHQVEPKAQLRLVSGRNGNACALSTQESSANNGSPSLQSHEASEVSDVLITPRFVTDERKSDGVQDVQNLASSTSQLKGVHQAMILAECISIQKRARGDELQNWEMAPYIEAIDSQKSSPFILHCFCNILRVRWESNRGRTKQRALLMMEELVQSIDTASPGVSQRTYYSFGVSIPTIPALRKEFGDLLVSCGLVGEAVKIYEDLELWDNLIYCYQKMDKKADAVSLIKTRLIEKPSDPRLWCSLGDVTEDDASYTKALEVSGHRSSRAYRSLARSAYSRGDYEKSKALWESAMALNSMYPDGWFALGAAALKARDVDKALDAFTRAVQLDPENGEAWNNIACLHMIKKRNKESFIAFKEALKLKRDSWQMWENYSHVAADVGNFTQAMQAVWKVLDLSKMKRTDCELLERIMLEIEKRASSSISQSNVSSGGTNHTDDQSISPSSGTNCDNEPTKPEVEVTNTRETEHLIQLMGQILKKIYQSAGNAESYGLYARWHRLKGDLTMCAEALLRQVRSYQGSDVWKDKELFTKYARASLELSKVNQELALRAKSSKELFTAEMRLKAAIKQAVNFSETEEYRELVGCLEDVQGSLKSLALLPVA